MKESYKEDLANHFGLELYADAWKKGVRSHCFEKQVPRLTRWDYVRHEPSIAMAMVIAMLCFFATLGCPNRSTTNISGQPTVED